MAIKVYSPIDFEDTSSGLSIDGDFAVDTNTFFVDVSADRVGIGTTSPSYSLDVSGNLRSSSEIVSNSYIKTTSGNVVRSELNSSNFSQLESNSSGGLITGRSSGTTTLSLSSYTNSYFNGGNVGIGTSSPATLLHLSSANPEIRITDTSNTNYNSIRNIDGNFWIEADKGNQLGNSRIRFSVDNAEAMRIDTGGNVLIGTTTDSGYKLDVSGTFRNTGEATVGDKLYLTNVASSGADGILAFDSTNTSSGSRIFSFTRGSGNALKYHSYGYHLWQSGAASGTSDSTSRMILDSYGRLGIGTTSPSSPLAFGKSTYGDFDSENFFRIKFEDVGGVHNDVGIGQTASGSLGFNVTNGGSFIFNNGTSGEAMTIKAGNVGIGTTSPQDLLHLSASSPVLRLTNTSDTGKSSIEFWDNQGGTSQSGEVFYDDSSNLFGLQANANGIVFRASNTFPGSELMRLTSTGRLGIGTSSPADKLTVNGDISIFGNKIYNGSASNSAGIDLSDSQVDLHGYYGIRFFASTAGIGSMTERMRITNTGSVGIGTASPDQLLHVSGNTKTTNLYVLGDIIHDGDADTKIQFNTDAINFDTAGVERLRINPAGDVGIGTTTPNHLLDVESTGASARIYNLTSNGDTDVYLTTTGTTGASRLLFGDDADNDIGRIIYRNNGNSMAFETNAAEAMRINSSGNVGIGTTSPTDKLTVDGNSATIGSSSQQSTNLNIIATNTAGAPAWTTAITMQGYEGRGQGIFFTDTANTNEEWFAGINYGNSWDTYSIGYDASGGQAEYTANAILTVKNNGNVGIGTTSPGYKLDVETSDDIVASFVSTDNKAAIRINDNDTNVYVSAENSRASFGFNTGAHSNNINITSGGNVLIGTTTDSGEKLYVSGSIKATSNILAANNVYAAGSNGFVFGSSTSEGEYIYRSGNDIRLHAGGSDILTVDGDNSRVGIGTTSPSGKLHIAPDANSNYVFTGTSTSGYTATFNIDDTGLDIGHNSANRALNLKTNSADRLTITGGGNVGIGTTSPGEKLDVAGNIQASGSRFIRAEYDSNHYMQLESNSSGGILKGLDGGTTTVLVRSYGDSYFNGGDFGIGTSSPSNKLHVVGDFFLKGSNTSSSTKNFQVQTGNGTSIMDFRNDAYAFFGCGQGGGSASGFIFRYNSTFGVQFTGYNYGNGSSPSYKPILMDTDLAGRSQGVYINYGITGYTAPAPTSNTEFAVRGRGTSSNYTAKFEDSSTNPLLYIKDNGNVTVGTATDSGYKFDVEGNTNTNGDYYVNGNQGWSGTINIPTNPPISITVEGGIITNVT